MSGFLLGDGADGMLARGIGAVHGRYGHQFFLANDDTIGRSLAMYGEWAENEISLIEHLLPESGTLLDVGCNVGTHAIAFASLRRSSLVLAFDIQGSTLACANLTAHIQGKDNIVFVRSAVGDSVGHVRVPIVDYTKKANFGAVRVTEDSLGALVPQISLDSLAIPAPVALIKLDIEGSEIPALCGAQELIKRDRPVVFAESHGIDAADALIAFAVSQNLQWATLRIPAFNPNNFLRGETNIFGDASECAVIMADSSATIDLLQSRFGSWVLARG